MKLERKTSLLIDETIKAMTSHGFIITTKVDSIELRSCRDYYNINSEHKSFYLYHVDRVDSCEKRSDGSFSLSERCYTVKCFGETLLNFATNGLNDVLEVGKTREGEWITDLTDRMLHNNFRNLVDGDCIFDCTKIPNSEIAWLLNSYYKLRTISYPVKQVSKKTLLQRLKEMV